MSILTAAVMLVASMTMEFESDGSGFIELNDSLWIEPGSIIAIVDGDTLLASSGVSGLRTGILLNPSPEPFDTVFLEFDLISLDIPSSIRLDIESAENRIVHLLSDHRRFDPVQEHGLYISGSKRIGFSVGDGGGLDQGTRITVEGIAAPGITVSGSITDRNLSTGPNSSELVSQLDRIFFLVDGGSWRARLGDMDWISGNEPTGPLVWSREISGVDLEGSVSSQLLASAGYGTSGDTRQRTVFFTEEGIQGPYDVTSGWEIVSGSEKVWLDGETMVRGATSDYEMEYTAGLITFTSNRLIRNDQRVEITFSQRGDGFRKDLITASVFHSAGGLEVGLKGFFVEDDKKSPLGFILTDEAVNVLSNAGEDPSEAWIDGATDVGEGNGNYSRDSLDHYVFEGPGQGNWDVIFNRPPSGSGDYIYDSSIGGYLWFGEGSGTHLPQQYIQIPGGYRTGGIIVKYSSDALNGELETAVSGRTGNLFNSDATTREGTCIRGNMSFDFWENGPGLGLRGTLVTSGYEPPDELEADSSISAWSLPPDYKGKDNIAEVSIGGEGLLVTASGRFMEEGGILERYRASSNLDPSNIAVFISGVYLKRNDTDHIKPGESSGLSISAIPLSGTLKPFGGLSGTEESWSDSLSGSVKSGYVGLSLEKGLGRALVRFELQDDSRSGGPLSAPFNVWRARLEGSGMSGVLRYGGSIEHSSTSYDMGGELHADAITASLRGTFESVWVESIYNGSGTISRSLDVIYLWAGEGEGNYSYDSETGQYYPDPDGDYNISYQPGGAGDTITSASLETTVSTTGISSGLNSLLRLSSSSAHDRLKTLSLIGAFNTEEEGGYSIDLSPWFRWETGLLRRFTVTGKLRNERISYSGSGLRAERSWSIEAAPLLNPARILVIECSGRLWRKEEELYSPRDTRGLRISVDPSVEFSPGVKPGFLAALEIREEIISNLRSNMIEAGPHFSLMGGGWTAYAMATAEYIPGDDDLPVWFFEGNDSGLSWRTSARVGKSISSGFDIRIYYWGRKPSGSDWTQRAGLEGTVNF